MNDFKINLLSERATQLGNVLRSLISMVGDREIAVSIDNEVLQQMAHAFYHLLMQAFHSLPCLDSLGEHLATSSFGLILRVLETCPGNFVSIKVS